MTTVAVMQPYFLPYAGYFRLFAAADCVALFDCVQFPRRGWVHRNRLPNAAGDAAWFTLPILRAPVSTRIMDLQFAADADARLMASCRRFPELVGCDHPLVDDMLRLDDTVCDYLEKLLHQCCTILELSGRTIRTSVLDLDPSLQGQDRVLAAAKALNADSYINLEGGRSLYDAEAFDRANMQLRVLPDWRGSRWSILHRLLTEPADDVAREIRAQV